TVTATDGADNVFLTTGGVEVNGRGFSPNESPATWVVNLKGGNDHIEIFDTSVVTIFGGDGNDTFFPFESVPNSLSGGNGNDAFLINETTEVPFGVVSGWDGGAGIDRVDCTDRAYSGVIDLNVSRNIENVVASAFTTKVVGNALNNRITAPIDASITMQGNGGHDTLVGN